MNEFVSWMTLGISGAAALLSFIAMVRAFQQDTDRKVDFDYYDGRHEGLRRDNEAAFKALRSDFEASIYRLSERVRYLEIRQARTNGRPISAHFEEPPPK